MSARGWAAARHDEIDIRSVGPTRRSAIVNELWAALRITITDSHTDAEIEAMWARRPSGIEVREVIVEFLS